MAAFTKEAHNSVQLLTSWTYTCIYPFRWSCHVCMKNVRLVFM